MTPEQLRSQILELTRAYADSQTRPAFVPGKTPVPPSGKVLGAKEIENAVDAALDGWLTTGRFNAAFEQKLGAFLDAEFVLTTNSGSSANLLAISALTSPLLGERALKPGAEARISEASSGGRSSNFFRRSKFRNIRFPVRYAPKVRP